MGPPGWVKGGAGGLLVFGEWVKLGRGGRHLLKVSSKAFCWQSKAGNVNWGQAKVSLFTGPARSTDDAGSHLGNYSQALSSAEACTCLSHWKSIIALPVNICCRHRAIAQKEIIIGSTLRTNRSSHMYDFMECFDVEILTLKKRARVRICI